MTSPPTMSLSTISAATVALRPSPAQLVWQHGEVGAFFHFGVNTFCDLEWSDGTQPPSVFDPSDLDTDDWLAAAASFGATYALLTAKHHDGFCLWPTETTSYAVTSSPWRGGRGDVVGDFVASCRAVGIRPGLYLSPWDRNHPAYDDPAAYDEVYCAQLTELCTRYGELAELWFDGAGSESRAYDWDRIMAVCRTHQPQAVIFNMGEFTIRWVGNEEGYATDPVDYVVRSTPISMFTGDERESDGWHYAPPECDVSVRPGWFWHENEEPRTLEELVWIHDHSVGLGANLLLNLPPDRRGRVDPRDAARVGELGDALSKWYAAPVAARVLPASEPAPEPGMEAGPDAGWSRWVCVLPEPLDFDCVELAEDLAEGQRVRRHVIDLDGETIASGCTIGHLRRHHVGLRCAARLVVGLEGVDPRPPRVSVHRTGRTVVPCPGMTT